MKAEELRIGDLVLFHEDSTIFQVTGIEIGGLYVKNETISTWIEIDQFSPIPITEEWLVKFGFEKQENGWWKLGLCNDWSYVYYNTLAGTELSVNKHSICLPHIQYVHQLQNLYYSLTGEELTIKD